MKPIVLICDGLHPQILDKLSHNSGLSIDPQSKLTRNEVLEKVPQANILVIRSNTTVDKELIDRGSQLKLIIRAGEGTDNIDKVLCQQSGIAVANTPGANNNAAAEHAVALIFSLLRRIPWAQKSMEKGEWNKNAFVGQELAGKTLGLIGYGKIGKILAKRLQGFDLKVIVYDPFVSNLPYPQIESINDLLQLSDITSVHVPYSPQTHNLISWNELQHVKKDSLFINAARGNIVVEDDLIRALDENLLAGAALDVFDKEPLASESTLRNHPKLIITPHLGASTYESQLRVGEMVYSQIDEFILYKKSCKPGNKMNKLAIIGAQWGDEGKGKITDLMSGPANIVARFQGGNNAGHTIYLNGQQVVLHLIPSGILHDHCTAVISHGVVFDPESFFEELSNLEKVKKISPSQLKISYLCPVITRYHRLLDSGRENYNEDKIGTTGKGIGPCYEDKIGRRAIRLHDLLSKETLFKKVEALLREKELLLKNLYNTAYPSLEEEVERLYQYGQQLIPFLEDTFKFLEENKDKKILLEGAQGALLDIDFGSYPYVTSSNTTFGGIATGIGPNFLPDEILGISKIYTTRVGEGPFPTEMKGEEGDLLQKKGNEFGATTGRKRRCGHLDLPLLRYTVKTCLFTSLALTKVDITVGTPLKICTHYKYEGKTHLYPSPHWDLDKVTPVYKEFAPYHDNFQGEISKELTEIIEFIEKEIEIPVGIIAYGPNREEILYRKNYWNESL